MSLHRSSGNQRTGLLLATITMLVWSFLPHLLKYLVAHIDPYTLTWYRFAMASVGFGWMLKRRNALPNLSMFGRRDFVLLLVAILGLAANYICFLVGLDLTSPATSQVLIQIGPVLLAVGAIVIFRERFTPAQWGGFVILVSGLLIFFQSQLAQLAGRVSDAEQYQLGVLTIVVAAISWATYGLAQKQLLTAIPSQPLMLCLFLGCTLLYLPAADPRAVTALDGAGLIALALSAVATAVAYGCFSASLEHIEASRVSALIALVPLGTLASSYLLSWLVPELVPRVDLSSASFMGAGAVVVGSLITALAGRPDDGSTR